MSRVLEKQRIGQDMATFAFDRYRLVDTACVVMWREFYRDWCEYQQKVPPEWIRDSAEVRSNMKKYIKQIRTTLEAERGVVVCTVNNNVRKYIKHGEPPHQDDRVRTDEFYRKCVPSAKNPTMGFVSFPSESYQDHPLLICQLTRQSCMSATTLRRQIDRVDTAGNRGLISRPRRAAIDSQIETDVVYISHRVSRPAIEGPKE